MSARIWNFHILLAGYTMGQQRCRTVLTVSYKVKNVHSIWPWFYFQFFTQEKWKHIIYKTNKQTNKLPISFIHDISNLEITQISINNYVDKRIV